MGLDFIRRTAPSFEKKWDRGLAKLSQPRLFTREDVTLARTVLATFEQTADATVGKEYVVRSEGEGLVLIDGLRRVGSVRSPPQEVMKNIEAAGGCALGRAKVVHQLSRSAELELE